jgi:hypothetical protein
VRVRETRARAHLSCDVAHFACTALAHRVLDAYGVRAACTGAKRREDNAPAYAEQPVLCLLLLLLAAATVAITAAAIAAATAGPTCCCLFLLSLPLVAAAASPVYQVYLWQLR